MSRDPVARRALSRALSRAADAGVFEALRNARESRASCRRIGVTGPPGVGKSSLIARLARQRLEHPGDLAIVAIDPTSPVSGGAILGDRIRMEDLATDPRVYIRSLASRGSLDGLADNLPDMLALFDDAGFAELIVETVGVGQVEYAVRNLVETTVLVLMPGTGDYIQAMKGGILETADLYVVNKADQPGAPQLAAELRSMLKARRPGTDWMPPILPTSLAEPEAIARLGAAIDRHQAWIRETGRWASALERRRIHHVGSLVARRVGEVLHELPPQTLQQSMLDLFRTLVERLMDGCDGRAGDPKP
jgi:LAO/AO transport system kinase